MNINRQTLRAPASVTIFTANLASAVRSRIVAKPARPSPSLAIFSSQVFHYGGARDRVPADARRCVKCRSNVSRHAAHVMPLRRGKNGGHRSVFSHLTLRKLIEDVCIPPNPIEIAFICHLPAFSRIRIRRPPIIRLVSPVEMRNIPLRDSDNFFPRPSN